LPEEVIKSGILKYPGSPLPSNIKKKIRILTIENIEEVDFSRDDDNDRMETDHDLLSTSKIEWVEK
jgi:hypothetical protein